MSISHWGIFPGYVDRDGWVSISWGAYCALINFGPVWKVRL